MSLDEKYPLHAIVNATSHPSQICKSCGGLIDFDKERAFWIGKLDPPNLSELERDWEWYHMPCAEKLGLIRLHVLAGTYVDFFDTNGREIK